MADIKIYFPKLLKWEGGFVNDPTDRGGATNMGVTLGTWKQVGYDNDGDGDIDAQDVKLLTKEQAMSVCKHNYWNRWLADGISNQSVAESLVEWVWGSGKWGVIIPQRILGVKQDGIVGYKTLAAVNAQNQQEFFNKLVEAKMKFIDDLIKAHPEQKKFEKGWKNRINDFKFFL